MQFPKFMGLLVAFSLICSSVANAQIDPFNHVFDSKQPAIAYSLIMEFDSPVDLDGQLFVRSKNNYRLKRIHRDTSHNWGIRYTPEGTAHYLRHHARLNDMEYIYLYDDQQQLTERIVYTSMYSKGKFTAYNMDKFVYQYNEKGQLKEIAYFQKEKTTADLNPYNPANNSEAEKKPLPTPQEIKESSLARAWNDKPQQAWRFEYNDLSKLSSKSFYFADQNQELELKHSSKYLYSSEGMLQKMETYDYYTDKQGTLLGKYIFSYNAGNLLESIKAYNGKTEVYTYETVFEYDNNNLLTSILYKEDQESPHKFSINYQNDIITISDNEGFESHHIVGDHGMMLNQTMLQIYQEEPFKGYKKYDHYYNYEYEKIK